MYKVTATPRRLQGEVAPLGDKSISHRAVILNALAHGTATVSNFSPGGDCGATVRCLRALGVSIRRDAQDLLSYTVHGSGALTEPEDVLNAGNSGTTMRLLAGVLAAGPFQSVLTGDASLRRRPMDRIVHPLRLMGAHIQGRESGALAPLVIQGGDLQGINYDLPVASAQLKSALLLAGLSARGPTTLRQPAASRDHTELMLQSMGARLQADGLTVTLEPGPLRPVDVHVPADISSAAFFVVAAVVHPDAHLRIRNVGVNPTRCGILETLQAMGAHVSLEHVREEGGELVADLVAQSSTLTATEVGGEVIPRMIDELPLLALAACFAQGTTVIRDAAELRVKESDRIRATVTELGRLGARIEELPDGMAIHGPTSLVGAPCRTYHDHRMVMTLAVAGLLARGETMVQGAEMASVSYPGFWDDLERLLATPAGVL